MSQVSYNKNGNTEGTVDTQPVPVHHDEECHLNNHLENSLKKLILPLHIMHCVTLGPKYTIRYDFITSNSFRVKLLSGFSSVCLFFTYAICYVFHNIIGAQGGRFIAVLLDPIVFLIGYLYNFLEGVYLSETHAELVIRLQKIQKAIGCMDKINKRICVNNWCIIGIMYTFYFTHTVVCYFTGRLYYGGLFRLFVILTLDSSITYSTRILVLLKSIIRSWISEMEKIFIIQDSEFQDNYNSQLENRWSTLEKSYSDIIKAYNIYKTLAMFPISYFVIMNFLEALISLRNTIGNSDYGATLIFTIVWMTKCLIQIAAISLECGNFCATVINAYVVCLYNVTFRSCTGRSQNLLKKVQHENMRASQPLSAYGFFDVDVKLILRYFSVVTTYVVILLQFNFL